MPNNEKKHLKGRKLLMKFAENKSNFRFPDAPFQEKMQGLLALSRVATLTSCSASTPITVLITQDVFTS